MASSFKAPVTWISNEEKFGAYALRLKGHEEFFRCKKQWDGDVKKGAVIELEARREKDGKNFEVRPGSVTVLEAPKSSAASGGGGWKGRGGKGGGGGYNDPERQAQITWQHSQEMAITTADVLLSNEAYKLGAKNKPQERYKQIIGLIDDLTVKFFEDVTTRKPAEAAKAVREEIEAADEDAEWSEDAEGTADDEDQNWDDDVWE